MKVNFVFIGTKFTPGITGHLKVLLRCLYEFECGKKAAILSKLDVFTGKINTRS